MTKDLKKRIIEMTADDLEKVEAALVHHLNPNLELVREIASHLLFSGGKRLRPLLMIHSARLCGYSGGSEIEFSTIFEYLHAATLLHDDVVDKADTRRGKKTAHTQWPAPKVILTGDFLLALSLDLASRTQQPKIISVIAGITRDMSQGEINQLGKKGKIDLSETEYLDIIEKKTAVLIRGACQSGAILANTSKERQEALRQYGFHTGMAFQMADDLLDYSGTKEALGKAPGADIREGKLTLPVIHSLCHASPEDRTWMEKIITDTEFIPEQFDMFRDKLVRYKGIDYTRKCAQDHVKKATRCLDGFEEGPSKELLCMIAEYSIERKV
ncbi:MAG: polyprenyl synthetase [Desulfobacterales bacterium RIFOXYA12_FULL_46_15]|nr:MAG: polyprenyl synthetase [Desulfobacterales bacterium RIFOXYA12_FULL_46_15]